MALDVEDDLRSLVSPIVAAAGFDLEGVAVRAGRGTRVVRVIVDRDGGVDLDAAAELSRQISARLDESTNGVMGTQLMGTQLMGTAPYTLEVTSPGIGRPLTETRHFRRAAGRLVTITGHDGSQQIARLACVTGDDLLVLTGADGLTPTRIPLRDVARATIEPEFAPPPAPVAAALAGLQASAADPTPDSREGEGAR